MKEETNIPWETEGKTISQLINELKSFEDQELEVRVSIDDGDTHFPISIVEKDDGKCVLSFISYDK